jgi:L-lactate dehydrogenase complex protein LldF
MANLDRYLEQMADNVEARGGNVFFAEDGEAVVRYIGDLARRKGAKVITKSKSMATEEIELNRRLEEGYSDLDLEIVETDLGEWIAQLAGDHPSHIVGPILHMNRRRADPLRDGRRSCPRLEPWLLRPQALGEVPHRESASPAPTSGSLQRPAVATITTRGTPGSSPARPPVHVVVMGIEKGTRSLRGPLRFHPPPRLAAAGPEAHRSTPTSSGRATGGARRGEELHLILMDNWPLRPGSGYETSRKALYCIRCWAPF